MSHDLGVTTVQMYANVRSKRRSLCSSLMAVTVPGTCSILLADCEISTSFRMLQWHSKTLSEGCKRIQNTKSSYTLLFIRVIFYYSALQICTHMFFKGGRSSRTFAMPTASPGVRPAEPAIHHFRLGWSYGRFTICTVYGRRSGP